MARVDPDQLAALQRLPAAFGHVEVLEANPLTQRTQRDVVGVLAGERAWPRHSPEGPA